MSNGVVHLRLCESEFIGAETRGAQIDALRAAGCEIIRGEMRSGTSTEGRTGLRTLIEFARAGDMIVVTRIDRLARSVADLAATVPELEQKNVSLRATEQPIDTSTAPGRCFPQMLRVFAEFGAAIRKEQQMGASPRRRPKAATRDGPPQSMLRPCALSMARACALPTSRNEL